ncbi:MAG: PAS domain S-box protein [Kiloniellaceae bacterium]
MKLSTRLMLGMVGLVLAASAAIGLIAYLTLADSLYPAKLTRMEADARLMAERLVASIHEAGGDVLVSAASPSVAELMHARRVGDSEAEADWNLRLARLFVATLRAKPEYLQIRLIGGDNSGREIVRVDRSTVNGRLRVTSESELQVKGGRPYFIAALDLPPGGIHVSPVELNQEKGMIEDPPVPVVRVAAPVHGPHGRALGVIAINLDMRSAFERLRGALEPGINVYVVNGRGDYLVHPNRAREFAFEYGAPDRLQRDFPELADLLRPMDGPYQISRRFENNKGSADAVAAAATNLGRGVRVAILLMAPSSLVLAAANDILKSAATIGLAAILCAALLAFLLSRTIAQPLAQLTRSVQRFDRGELVRLPHHVPKEIGILVNVFRQHIERERLFNAAVQSSTDAILTLSLDGQITAWNHAAEKLFGYTAEEAVGKSLKMLIPEDLLEEFQDVRSNLLKGLPTGPIETVRLAKNGHRADVSLSVSPVRSLSGEITGASAIYRDITDLKRADEMFRLAVDASPAAMIMTDRDGRILLANNEAVEVFGYGHDDLMGMKVEDLMPGRVREKHHDLRSEFMCYPDKRFMGTGRDLYGLRADGTEFPLEIALNPIDGPKGAMVLSVVVDITERKRTAAELERRTNELQHSNAELQQFAFVASHDLQEPLRMVTSFCELLKERYGEQLGSDGNEFVDFAVDGARRMRQLINDLLDYSRLQTRDIPLAEVSINDVLNIALLNLSERIREVDAEILAGDLPTVSGNEPQLTQLFQNLIGNALKFTVSERPRVEVTAVAERENWLFTVRDNGIGIDPLQKEAIFGVFQRLHTRDEFPGTGIGLAICKRIVESHGGRIWVESTLGVGTAMHFTVKAAVGAEAPEEVPDVAGETALPDPDVRRTG